MFQVHSHIRSTIDKFKPKIERNDLKRLAKEVTKKLVESDYKYKRVSDPSKMDKKYTQAAKKYAAEYLNKFHKKTIDRKREEYYAKKAAAAAKKSSAASPEATTTPPEPEMILDDEEEVQVSDDDMAEGDEQQNVSKRKRDSETPATPAESESGMKKLKVDLGAAPPPPPPPQSAPADDGSATPTDEAPRQELSPAETNGSDAKDFAQIAMNGHRSPVQLATPLTNGSNGHANGH